MDFPQNAWTVSWVKDAILAFPKDEFGRGWPEVGDSDGEKQEADAIALDIFNAALPFGIRGCAIPGLMDLMSIDSSPDTGADIHLCSITHAINLLMNSRPESAYFMLDLVNQSLADEEVKNSWVYFCQSAFSNERLELLFMRNPDLAIEVWTEMCLMHPPRSGEDKFGFEFILKMIPRARCSKSVPNCISQTLPRFSLGYTLRLFEAWQASLFPDAAEDLSAISETLQRNPRAAVILRILLDWEKRSNQDDIDNTDHSGAESLLRGNSDFSRYYFRQDLVDVLKKFVRDIVQSKTTFSKLVSVCKTNPEWIPFMHERDHIDKINDYNETLMNLLKTRLASPGPCSIVFQFL